LISDTLPWLFRIGRIDDFRCRCNISVDEASIVAPRLISFIDDLAISKMIIFFSSAGWADKITHVADYCLISIECFARMFLRFLRLSDASFCRLISADRLLDRADVDIDIDL